MADRNVSMIAQVGGTVSNQYLRTIETVEQRQERLTGALMECGACGTDRGRRYTFSTDVAVMPGGDKCAIDSSF